MEVKDYTFIAIGLLFLALSLLTGGIVFYIALILTVLVIAADGFILMYMRFRLSRSLVVRRSLSRRNLILGTAAEMVTSFDYSGRKSRRILIRQPVDTSLSMITPVPEYLDFSAGTPVHLNIELKPVQAGEIHIEPLRLIIESIFFKDAILIGRKERLMVHIGIGYGESRSGSSAAGSKKYSDFILSKFTESRGSTDFSTIRSYAPGDDAKNIDWVRSARVGTLLVREYEEDHPMPVFFVLDVDSSMGIGDSSSELASAVNLTALIINKLTTDSNMFGLACFSPGDVVKYKALGIGRDHLSKVRDLLTELRPESIAGKPIKNDISLHDASSIRTAFRSTGDLELLSAIMDETIQDYFVNDKSDGFLKAIMKVSRSIGMPCQIVVMTNLSMGLSSLLNGIRMAKYYGHSVSVVLTPHIWYDDKEIIDAETCYEKYQQVKATISRIRGSGSVKVIDLCSNDRPEDAIYRNSTYRQSVGLRRW